MSSNDTLVRHIELFGSIEENFYQLGIRDKEEGKLVHKQVKAMLKTPFTPVNNLIEKIGKEIIKSSLLKDKNKYPHLNAYAEGMQIPAEELFYVMLMPEMVSAMTKWAPGAVAGNLGCSSFFMRNEKGEAVHGRILDFPLQGSYDQLERSVMYQLNNLPKFVGFNTVGIPYPSITAMTEDGMTIGLHQKFTNVFNKDGESIFEIIFDLIKNANDKKSAIEFLKTKKSLTTWCLYLGFKTGEVVGFDIMGDEHFINEYQLDEKKDILYFCNHLENKTLDQTNYVPLGFHDYNCMRESNAREKIAKFIKKDKFESTELLKMMTSPLETKSKNYSMDNVTPSTILAVTMNPTAQEFDLISGPAPKIYQDNIVKIKNCFGRFQIETIKDKKYKDQNKEYKAGLFAMMEAQKGFDDKDPQVIYHQLQFAIDHLENYNDQIIAKFYFLIAQYIYENHSKVQHYLLEEFINIEKQLTGYLQEQCWLFIFRLQYILNMPITIEVDRFTHKKLRSILELEQKVPRTVFHITNKLLIVPRIDILDVIYVYTY